MIPVYLRTAHTQPIKPNASVNCICIAYFNCFFIAGIHLPRWGTVVTRGKNISEGMNDPVHFWHLGNQRSEVIEPCRQEAFPESELKFDLSMEGNMMSKSMIFI